MSPSTQLYFPKISFFEYLLIFIFIVCCGFTSANIIPAKVYFLTLCGICYHAQYFKKEKFPYATLFVLIGGTIIVAIEHFTVFNLLDKGTIEKIPILLGGFSVMTILKSKFPYAYFNAIYILSLISIIFFILMQTTNIIIDISFLNSNSAYQGFFIYNIRNGEIILGRNCGPFWEPGAFAGYITIAFILFFNNWRLLYKYHKFKCLILIFTLLTTFSSQGYIVAFLLIASKYLLQLKKKNMFVVSIGITLFISVSVFTFNKMDFLREKMVNQLELAENWEDDKSLHSANRFTTTLLDLDIISKYLFFGKTNDHNILYEDYPFIIKYYVNEDGSYGSGSGMTGFIASNGIILFLLWLFPTIKSFKIYYGNMKVAFILLTIVFALGQGEAYLAYILFWSFPFLYLCKYTIPKS